MSQGIHQGPLDGGRKAELPHLVHHHRHHHHHHYHHAQVSPIYEQAEPTAPEAPIAIRPRPSPRATLLAVLLGAAIALAVVLFRRYLVR